MEAVSAGEGDGASEVLWRDCCSRVAFFWECSLASGGSVEGSESFAPAEEFFCDVCDLSEGERLEFEAVAECGYAVSRERGRRAHGGCGEVVAQFEHVCGSGDG